MERYFQTATEGDGGGFLATLGWLWLPVLLAAMGVLLASPRWRSGVTRATVALAGAAVAVAVGELTWRLLGEGAGAFPLTSWAVTLLVASLAVSALKARGPTDDRAADPVKPPAARAWVENPFRPSAAAPAGVWTERAVEQATDGIAVIDLDGGLELVNTTWARLHGFQAEETRGHHLSLFHTPEQMPEARERLAETGDVGSWTGEARHRRKDGTVFTVHASLSLLRDADGNPVGYLIVARPHADGEPAKARPAVAATSESNSAAELDTLRVLVAGVAHEYNNLLTGILGNSTLLNHKLAGGEGGQQVADVEKAARAAADLTRQLQAYAGNVRSSFRELRLGQWLGPALEELAGDMEGRATLHHEIDDEAPPVAADPRQLHILLRQLLANAIDAVEDGHGEITVRTGWRELDHDALGGMHLGTRRAPGTYAFVEVGDNGHGVEAQTRERMFDPFYTTRQDRQGLGLTTVLGIVRGHRGAVAVDSAAGEGTRVRVVFPCAEQRRPSVPAAPAAPEPPATTTRPRARRAWQGNGTVLVVDNEQIIRDLATSILEIHGFSVLTAADGEPALELYRERRDDIRAVLLDLSMPMMDGREVFERLRRIDPEARVIVMTGHAAEEVQAGFGEGLAGVLQKPFRPEQLIGILRQTLGG